MKQFMAAFIFLLFLSVVPNQTAHSQEQPYCNFCFRGNPKPNCCTFLIFEGGFLFSAFRAGERSGKEAFLITGDMGVMFNIKNSKAWGGSFHIAADDDGARFGFGPRFRAWYKHNIALDLSPRLMLGGSANYGVRTTFPGFALSASISVKDFVSIDSYFQITPYERILYNQLGLNPTTVKETETGLYLGISGRSYLAPAVPVLLLILVGATWGD